MLDDDIKFLVDNVLKIVLMQRLGQVLGSPHKTTQEMALAAIAATAVASEQNFLPYAEVFLFLLLLLIL